MDHRDRKGKGSGFEQSTTWSGNTWDERGTWSSVRQDHEGEKEYHDRYPESQDENLQHETIADYYTTTASPPISDYQAAASSATLYTSDPVQFQSTISSGYGTYNVAGPSVADSYYGMPSNTYQPHAPAEYRAPATTSSYSIYSPEAQIAYTTNDNYAADGATQYTTPGMSFEPGVRSITSGLASLSFQGSAIPPQIYEGEGPNPLPIVRSPRDEVEMLDPRYKTIEPRKSKKFWKVGRVFVVLWTEPSTSNGIRNRSPSPTSRHMSTYLGAQVYSELRRFVVLSVNYGNCICSPIHTYGGQATLKPNLPETSQHAIIYTSQDPPEEHAIRLADGTVLTENLSKDPIKVRREQDSREGDLGTKSRINFSKIYTVEQNVRVLNIGIVENLTQLEEYSFIRPRDTPPERPRKFPDAGKRKDRRRGRGSE